MRERGFRRKRWGLVERCRGFIEGDLFTFRKFACVGVFGVVVGVVLGGGYSVGFRVGMWGRVEDIGCFRLFCF